MRAVTDVLFSLFLEAEGLRGWPLVAQDEPCQHQHVPIESLCGKGLQLLTLWYQTRRLMLPTVTQGRPQHVISHSHRVLNLMAVQFLD